MAGASRRKKINRSAFGNGLSLFLLCVLGAFMALPVVYALMTAFKPVNELFMFPPRFFVRNPTLNNFTMLIQLTSNMRVPFSRYLFNSVLVTFLATVGHVLIASMAAYPLAKHRFPGKRLINAAIVLALLFTPAVTYIPQYIVVARLGLINTYGALVLPVIQSSLGIYLMKQFMGQIPDSMLEAARLDGASELRPWFLVVMPAVRPAWLTIGIFAFQGIWNSNGGAFIYEESMKVLPTIMNQIAAGGLVRAGVTSAVSLILMVPPVLLFVFSQRQVIETMTTSGIKE
jgi:ABC-type glycerol-3-phosphate transport system permease component